MHVSWTFSESYTIQDPRVLTVAEKDSIKAMVLKIGHRITKKAFKNSLRVTGGSPVNMLQGQSSSSGQASALKHMTAA